VALAAGATRFVRFAGAAEEAPGKWKWLFVNGSESKGMIYDMIYLTAIG
jgi:hypothetical protein